MGAPLEMLAAVSSGTDRESVHQDSLGNAIKLAAWIALSGYGVRCGDISLLATDSKVEGERSVATQAQDGRYGDG